MSEDMLKTWLAVETILVCVLLFINIILFDYNNQLVDAYNGLLKKYRSTVVELANVSEKYMLLSRDYEALFAEYSSLRSDFNSLYRNYTALSAEYSNLSAEHEQLSEEYQRLNASYTALKKAKGIVFPTYEQLVEFVRKDDADELEYVEDFFTCKDFTDRFIRNFMNAGFFSCDTEILFNDTAHSIVAVMTSDRGLVFVEPQDDTIIPGDDLVVGVDYCKIVNWYCSGWVIEGIKHCFMNDSEYVLIQEISWDEYFTDVADNNIYQFNHNT